MTLNIETASPKSASKGPITMAALKQKLLSDTALVGRKKKDVAWAHRRRAACLRTRG